MSSMCLAVCGKSSLTQVPQLPCCANLNFEGATGKLIWETKVQGSIALRGLAIYGDNLYIATKDAHILAINAKTGKVLKHELRKQYSE